MERELLGVIKGEGDGCGMGWLWQRDCDVREGDKEGEEDEKR